MTAVLADGFFSVAVLGTVGQWMSGLGTIVAFIGLYRLVRKDRKEKLNAHAQELVCWIDTSETTDLSLHILNTGNAPFTNPEVVWELVYTSRDRETGRERNKLIKGHGFIDNLTVIPPDKDERIFYPELPDALQNLNPLGATLEYLDRSGRKWRQVIDLKGSELYHVKDVGVIRWDLASWINKKREKGSKWAFRIDAGERLSDKLLTPRVVRVKR